MLRFLTINRGGFCDSLIQSMAAFGFRPRQIRKSFATLHFMKITRSAFIVLTFLSLATLGQNAHAVSPPPDGCYTGFTTAEGCNSLHSLTTGVGNTGVGWYSLFGDSFGSYNTAIGAGALDLNNADNNTAIGAAALLLNTTGNNNTATGVDALVLNTTGIQNIANGAFALQSNTVGSGNIAIGYQAGAALTNGDNNIDIGSVGVAAESNTIRIGDPAIHAGIFLAGITAMSPVAPNQAVIVDPATGRMGSADISSFGVVSTDPENTAVGDQVLVSNMGEANTGTGFHALLSNTSGVDNTATGAEALENNETGAYNDAVGAFALSSNIDGSFNNAFGDTALSANVHGADNTALGDLALSNNDSTGAGEASFNTAVGAQALFQNTDGESNNAIGFYALGFNTTGRYNQAMGVSALLNNTTGSFNVAIGDSAGSNVTTADNVICIGDLVAGDNVSDSCYIGNISGRPGGSQAVYVNGNGKLGFQVSSRRFKDEIKPMKQASEAIYDLRPVSFRYKTEIEPTRPVGFGLIAEDVEKVNPDLVTRDAHGTVGSVRYDAVNAMLLNEFLKEHKTFLEEQHKVQTLETQVTNLMATVKEQSAKIQKVSAQLELRGLARQTALNNR